MTDPQDPAAAKEIRLALVCYGGVSLAIYMHGVTKELFKLVRAARAFDDAPDGPNPFAADEGADSERAYFDALVSLRAQHRPCTVVVDVIAGTSAGGINGVCLARGLSQNRSLDGFRQLWIDQGDINTLLEGHTLFPGGRIGMITKLIESVLRLERHPKDAPLNGARMSMLLHDALRDMPSLDGPATLVRADQSLDLFTTTTSVHGYQTAVPTGAGGISHTDRGYRQVMHFHHEELQRVRDAVRGTAAQSFASGFGDGDVPGLAFAARATSSFPGAFPPVSLATFADAVAGFDRRGLDAIARHFYYGLEFGETFDGQWFMDGGVLDNGPFDLVVDAIAGKRASGLTAREIVYIEPDPGDPPQPVRPEADDGQADDDDRPTVTKTLWTARMTIPQHTPLVETLTTLRTMNLAIAEIGAVVECQGDAVLQVFADDAQLADLAPDASYVDVSARAGRVRDQARELAPLTYPTYCRLRAESVADWLAVTLARELGFPARSNRSAFVSTVFGAWVRKQAVWRAADPTAMESMLGALDIPFRLRRAEFVLAGVNAMLGTVSTGPRGADLCALKTAAWDLISRLRLQSRNLAAELRGAAAELFADLTPEEVLVDPVEFIAHGARGHGAQLDELYRDYARAATRELSGSSQDLWNAFGQHTASWDEATRDRLLIRYLGYPVWDTLIFPIIAQARLPQLSPISVQRFSPLDADCLPVIDEHGEPRPRGSAKLAGVALGHFGGFFKKSWRENDYLWGRLDGAELAMRLLTRHSRRPVGTDGVLDGGVDLAAHLRDALTAILNAEGDLKDLHRMRLLLCEQAERIADHALQ